MDDNDFSFIKNLIGDTHDEEAPAPVQEMPPSHTPRYSARHKKSFLSFLKKGPQKAARKRLPPQIVSIYFGVPGSGKTTYAAYLARHDIRRGIPVWSNVPITGCYQLDPKTDIGTYMITGGRVIIDEAGIEYNNRDFKDFSKKSLYFYKYHRHYQLAIDVFSQGFDDMDKKIRTLAQKLYVVKKGLLPWFIHRRQIKKRVGINDMSKEIIDEYYFVPWSTKIIFSPPLWKMFNTISREEYPQKQWKKW